MIAIRDRVVELRRVRAGDIRPHPKNWRGHPKAQQAALDEALASLGMADVLLAYVAGDGVLTLVDGHARRERDLDAVWPVVILDLSDAEAEELLATLDPLAALAETNRGALDELRAAHADRLGPATELMLADVSARAAALEERPTNGSKARVDRVPPVAAEPTSKLGDLWLLGEHRLICGDSTKASVVARLLAGRRPFIMVTDPPYGVDYDPEWRKDTGLNNSEKMGQIGNDHRASWAAAFAHFPGAVAYVWHAGKYGSQTAAALAVQGLEIRNEIIWVKRRFAISRGSYHWRHEPCYYAVRKGETSKWIGGRRQDTVWSEVVDGVLSGEELFAARVDVESIYAFEGSATTVWDIPLDARPAGDHSTVKPVECMARPIRNHGGSEDDVFDPFVGAGTTIIAAEGLGRRCFACELNPAYVDQAVARWEALTGRKASRAEGGS